MTTSADANVGRTALQTVLEAVERGRDAITAQRVFGDPVERDGVVVIPAAAVRGGGGGGGAAMGVGPGPAPATGWLGGRSVPT